MPLTPGTRLGPYEILGPLGAGGMGEVYRSRDARLDRDVAIKVLPSHLNQSPELRSRFEREAKAISGLQHPNICVLYDIGRQGDIDYLVMEYLEGETLASCLQKGPLPLDQVLRIGIQIADALEKAHRNGIIHRDLKPANVMLTKSGAKLMDFGLAKSARAPMSGPVSGAFTPSTPTMNVSALTSPAGALTQKGSIVGTFQYMAPEVLQGAEADARSDNFSFGCVLYEMTTGHRAFDGKSQVGVLAAILEKEPDPISATQPMTPPALDRLINICLAKDPEQRWQSAHDLKVQLQSIAEMGSQVGVPAVVAGARRQRGIWMTALATAGWLLAIIGVVATLYYSRSAADERQTTRAEIEIPREVKINFGLSGGVAISSDGHRLAFPAEIASLTKIWVRDLETGKTWVVEGTEGAAFPFWSPDSKSLGFFANGKLRTVAAAGSPVQILCDAPAGRGGSWSQSGDIIYTPNIEEGIYKVAEAGGTPVQVTKLGVKGFSQRNPSFLPDSKHFLFTQQVVGGQSGELYAGSMNGGDPKLLAQGVSNAVYAQGYLLYLKDRNLLAQRFDPSSMKVSGNPIPITENVEFWGAKDLGNFAASPTGTLVYRAAETDTYRFAWLRLPGRDIEEFADPVVGLDFSSGSAPNTRISADGKKIVFTRRNPSSPDSEIWVYDIDHKTLVRQALGSVTGMHSVFSPDGSKLAIASITGSSSQLSIKSLSNGQEQKLETPKNALVPYVNCWTPDGKFLLITVQDPKTQFDVYLQPVAGGNATLLLGGPYNETGGAVSPNQKWMAYFSSESGRTELFVTDFPGIHSKLQISSDGAYWHAWSREGRRLYFANGNKLMAAELRDPEKMEFGTTETVTTLDGVAPVGFAPDGRLLVLKQLNGGQSEPVHIVLHFPHSLEK